MIPRDSPKNRKKTACIRFIQTPFSPSCFAQGLLAQLVERLNGIEEVSSSNLLGSTILNPALNGGVFVFHDFRYAVGPANTTPESRAGGLLFLHHIDAVPVCAWRMGSKFGDEF